jgi:hypothetical protein
MLTKDFLNYKMASQVIVIKITSKLFIIQDNLTVATELGELGQISDVS